MVLKEECTISWARERKRGLEAEIVDKIKPWTLTATHITLKRLVRVHQLGAGEVPTHNFSHPRTCTSRTSEGKRVQGPIAPERGTDKGVKEEYSGSGLTQDPGRLGDMEQANSRNELECTNIAGGNVEGPQLTLGRWGGRTGVPIALGCSA